MQNLVACLDAHHFYWLERPDDDLLHLGGCRLLACAPSLALTVLGGGLESGIDSPCGLIRPNANVLLQALMHSTSIGWTGLMLTCCATLSSNWFGWEL